MTESQRQSIEPGTEEPELTRPVDPATPDGRRLNPAARGGSELGFLLALEVSIFLVLELDKRARRFPQSW